MSDKKKKPADSKPQQVVDDQTKKESKSQLLRTLDADVAQLFKNLAQHSERVDSLEEWMKTEYIPSHERTHGKGVCRALFLLIGLCNSIIEKVLDEIKAL